MSTLKKEKKEGEDGIFFHTTLTREIRPDRNWCELMEAWQSALTIRDMKSVLHEGYKTSLDRCMHDERFYDEIDCHIFYLTIADGWADNYLLKLPADEGKEYEVGCDSIGNIKVKRPNELRQQLAQKAFNELCLNFFEETELKNDRGEFYPNWENVIISERLFPVIQNFFRAEKGQFSSNRTKICNLSRNEKRSHSEDLAVSFLINLAKFMWGWREREIESWFDLERKKTVEEYNSKMRLRLNSAKPWMVEVLSQLGRLDVLQKWILDLDKACLAKLKEISLRNELSHYRHPVMEDRKVSSIDEACYLGSKAAWFLKKYELKKKEHERLVAILKAEEKKK